MCCHELNGYLEVLKLLVPTGQTLEQTIFGLVNGLHKTMCTTTNSNGELCSASMSSYLSDVVTVNDSLLRTIIFKAGVPLYAAAESDICSSLETPVWPVVWPTVRAFLITRLRAALRACRRFCKAWTPW